MGKVTQTHVTGVSLVCCECWIIYFRELHIALCDDSAGEYPGVAPLFSDLTFSEEKGRPGKCDLGLRDLPAWISAQGHLEPDS